MTTQNVYFAVTKNLDLPHEQITASIERSSDEPNHYTVILNAAQLARAMQMSLGDLDADLEDNFFDLLPGETRSVAVRSSATLEKLRAALQLTSVESATR